MHNGKESEDLLRNSRTEVINVIVLKAAVYRQNNATARHELNLRVVPKETIKMHEKVRVEADLVMVVKP